MTDINVHYYDGSWQDLTAYATAFQVDDYGIQKVPTATINLESEATDLATYLANPHKLIRIQIQPNSTWQKIFYGYTDKAHAKTVAGTFTPRTVASLDCFSFAARLAEDYITEAYYDLQSAQSGTPGYQNAATWTYRKMIQDFLDHPDSRYPTTGFDYATGFAIAADVDSSGIDAEIGANSNFSHQTLFEAIRLSCENIGYDGYYYLQDESHTPQVILAPFDKDSTATLTAPFIGEPEWISGSLADVGNIIFIEGGVDKGVPSDGDRYTEYGATKYSPSAWTATATIGTPSITDVDNTHMTDSNGIFYGVGIKSVKFASTSGSGGGNIEATLDLSKTAEGSANCFDRCANLFFSFYPHVPLGYSWLFVSLTDTTGNIIVCRPKIPNKKDHVADYYQQVYNINIALGTVSGQATDVELANESVPKDDIDAAHQGDLWWLVSGSSFDWENVVKVTFSSNSWQSGSNVAWSFEIDALEFAGGIKIDPFYILNPPAVDFDSISDYGVHVYPHSDSLINSFEQAQAEAARLLNNLHNPIPTLTAKKLMGADSYGTMWDTPLYPSDVVTVQSVDYRIAHTSYDWSAKTKEVTCNYEIVTKTSQLPPIWASEVALRLLMK